MYKANPNLGIFLAEQALRTRLKGIAKDDGRKDIIRFCREAGKGKNCQKLAYRLQRLEINRVVVDTVLQSLPEEKKELMIRKYRKNEMLVKISMSLNVSIAQLCLWDKAILGEIRDMMMYRLTERDIFSRLKVLNLVHILDWRLKFLADFPELRASVSHEWLDSLEVSRKKYRALLGLMENIVLRQGETWFFTVVGTKLQNPLYNTAELADACRLSAGSVSRHLKIYAEQALKYVSA